MTGLDEHVSLEIRSPLDGTAQRAMLRLPRARPAGPLPLVFAPHPFGWSVEDDYHGGCPGLKAPEHRGWLGVAALADVAILQPEGHHREVERCSMGYEGVVRDFPAWLEAVAEVVPVDARRVYACGLSMGGLESLLVAGSYPDRFAAAFVFNPVVDPAAWCEDLARSPDAELRAEGNDRLIVAEVGATPDAAPEAYARRSGLSVVEGLSAVPLSIWWSHLDLVVPRQVECHGKRVYDELKRRDPFAPVTEYDHTVRFALPAEPSNEQRWAVHETADYAFATRWLLLHQRR